MSDVDKPDDVADAWVDRTDLRDDHGRPKFAVLHPLPDAPEWLHRAPVGGQVTQDKPAVLTDIDGARAFLASVPDSTVLYLVPHPVHDLALALQAGRSVADALEASATGTRAAIDFARTDQRRILMADRDAAVRKPALLASALRNASGIELAVPEPEPEPGPEPAPETPRGAPPEAPSEAPSGHQAFAMFSYMEDTALRRLLAEFEALVLPVGRNAHNRSDWEEGVAEFSRLRAEAARARAQDDPGQRYAALRGDFEVLAQVEASLTRRNLALLQDLAAADADRTKVRTRLTELKEKFAATQERLFARTQIVTTLKSDLAAERRKLVRIEAELKAARQDILRLGIELEARDKRLDARSKRLADVKAELARTQAQVQALEARLTSVEQSTSWRLTSPLRAMRMGGGRSGGN